MTTVPSSSSTLSRGLGSPALAAALALLADLLMASPAWSATPGRLTFASYAVGAAQAQKAVVLTRSIRSFAGAYRQAPVFLVADESASAVLERERDPNVRVLRLDMPAVARPIPLAVKAYAAAQAERAAAKDTDTLLWMDPETVLLAQPDGLVLTGRQAAALQPVFLLNRVGLAPDQPVDAYWSRIYRQVGLAESAVPAVTAVVDDARIRFYINCGVIAFRPSRGLGAEWARVLTELLGDDGYRREATADPAHALFLHQAVLSAVICTRTRPDELRWIPISHGYPLGVHARVPAAKRVARLNDVVCLIYDQVWDQGPEWMSAVPVDEPLRGWLTEAYESTLRPTDRILRQ